MHLQQEGEAGGKESLKATCSSLEKGMVERKEKEKFFLEF